MDILVEYEEAPSMFRFIALQEDLAEVLGVEVDLVMKTALKPAIGERILGEVVGVDGPRSWYSCGKERSHEG